MPVSAVLADDEVILGIGPGEHGSTYGGNPLACRVAVEALQILKDENLAERAEQLGKRFREALRSVDKPWIKEVRGKGLLNALEVKPESGVDAMEICIELKENGLLAKPTHETIIRFAPPLVITDQQLEEAIAIIVSTLKQF